MINFLDLIVRRLFAVVTFLLNTIAEWLPVLFRGTLYFFIASGPIFIESTKDIGDTGVLPPMQWWRIIISSSLAGAVALRAYTDGSIGRHIEKLHSNGGSDTSFFTKPPPLPPEKKP